MELTTAESEDMATLIWGDLAQVALWNGRRWVPVVTYRDLGQYVSWWGFRIDWRAK